MTDLWEGKQLDTVVLWLKDSDALPLNTYLVRDIDTHLVLMCIFEQHKAGV